ncbi:MAG: hypothetical protein ABI700_11250 [Chloroflexota bacterium]
MSTQHTPQKKSTPVRIDTPSPPQNVEEQSPFAESLSGTRDLSPDQIIHLQRTIGNQAVMRLIAQKANAATPSSTPLRNSQMGDDLQVDEDQRELTISEDVRGFAQPPPNEKSARNALNPQNIPFGESLLPLTQLDGNHSNHPSSPSQQMQIQRDDLTPRQQVDAALKSSNGGDVKDITDVTVATEDERIILIDKLLNHQRWFFGPRDGAKVEEIWNSFGGNLNRRAEANPELWKQTYDRGVEPIKLDTRELRFKLDVKDIAFDYLKQNEAFVRQQMEGMGLSQTPNAPVAAGNEKQNLAMQKAQKSADSIAELQKSKEDSKKILLGYAVKYHGGRGPSMPEEVLFTPFTPPPSSLEPPKVGPPVKTYAEVQKEYDKANDDINYFVSNDPLAAIVASQGSSAATKTFAGQTDPLKARAELQKAMVALSANIEKAKAMLGDQLDPLDLVPLHQQLFKGKVAAPKQGVDWSLFVNKTVATKFLADRDYKNAMAAMGFDIATQLMFLLAPLTGGASLFIELAAVAALAGEAKISADKFEALAAASKASAVPDTKMVGDEQVVRAKMIDDAATVAAAIAAMVTVTGIILRLRGGKSADPNAPADPDAPKPVDPNAPPTVEVPPNTVTFNGKPVAPTVTSFEAFHASGQTPAQVKSAGGFLRGGKNLDLLDHLTEKHLSGNPDPNTGLISTTENMEFARQRSVQYGDPHIYKVSGGEGWRGNQVWAERGSEFGSFPYAGESEITCRGIRWDKVEGWYTPTEGGKAGNVRLGEFTPNPDFKP